MSFSKRTVLTGLTPANKRYYKDDHRFIVTSAGRRSRKTIISINKLERRALKAGLNGLIGGRYFHAAPTRQQAKDIFWNRIKNNTKGFWIKPPRETDLKIFLPFDIEICIIGLDRPERLEGQPWHGGHISEFGNIKPEAWESNIFPVFMDTNGFCLIDGVPEGRNHYYDMALYASGGVIPKTLPRFGAYAERENGEWSFHSWYSSDILDSKNIKIAKDNLDPRTYRQEMEGSFESVDGLAYYGFSKENYSDCEYESFTPVHVGMDFNVNPMTATTNHIRGESVYQFSEEYLKNSNTYEMGETLKRKYGVQNTTIYPDATGKNRSSNATVTNLSILRKMGFKIKAKNSNPYVIDRINCFNSKIRSSTGEITYFINPKNCPYTVRDLNRVERTDDGRENKNQEKEGLVHISSAQGYLISYLFPINSGGVYAV